MSSRISFIVIVFISIAKTQKCQQTCQNLGSQFTFDVKIEKFVQYYEQNQQEYKGENDSTISFK